MKKLTNKQVALITCEDAQNHNAELRETLLEHGALMVWTPDREIPVQAGEQLMEQNKGRIDVSAAQRFLGDHYDTFDKKEAAGERTLCGHIDVSARGSLPWQPAYGIAGAVQNKAADAAMAEKLAFTAAAGHACNLAFHAAEHLKAHPEFAWQKEFLRDMNNYPWTEFRACDR